MQTHDYRATGALLLERVTPVIEALFGAFALNALPSDNGVASIARIAKHCDPQWKHIYDYLVRLAARLDVPFRDDGMHSMTSILRTLAAHFQVRHDDEWRQRIEHGVFEGPANLDVLFFLASRFNDGHNLLALTLEASWHDEQQKLFQCGGAGFFISQELRLSGASTDILHFGANLRKALLRGNVEECALLVAFETADLLAGISDQGLRKQVRLRVAEKLLSATSC
ncbi:hypothetical protein PQR66_09375 [Paraburkholderia agricolaris]|uniref:Uncharacterized protein n=1 Tax=Paraburkholderia agricolaris TaxID=2152888 RepID=A0ABW8ZKS9_9BURK